MFYLIYIFDFLCSVFGSGFMFKLIIVIVRENCNEIFRRVVVDLVNNQEDFKYILIYSEESVKDVIIVIIDLESVGNYIVKNN